MKVTIRRVGLLSLGRLGCLLGIVAAFLPSLLCGIAGLGLVGVVQRWLESWQEFSISLLGREVAVIDLIRLLELEGLLGILQAITRASGGVLVFAIVILALASGLILALIVLLVGLSYNALSRATGGIIVEMEAIPLRKTTE
ncbi:MAG: hypothetical protein PVG11_01085 [Anaerolineae bacterium]|jgi:hypothetical protein